MTQRLRIVGDPEPTLTLRAGKESPPEELHSSRGRPPGDEFDPWSTEDTEGYDETKFYTRSTNKFDHSAEMRGRIPPQLASKIAEIVDSKKFPPLRSVADFYRDAAVHRLHYLNQRLKDPELAEMLTLEQRRCRVEAVEAEITAMTDLVESHEGKCEVAYQVGDEVRLARLIGYLEDDVERLPEPYKGKLATVGNVYRGKLKRLVEGAK